MKLRSIKDDVILRGVAGELEACGIEVISASVLLQESVARAGLLSSRELSVEERRDAVIGWEAAKALGAADIGQTVVVSGESWAFGLPVFCSDMGPLHDRVKQHGGGWLLDPRDPAAWYDRMLQVMESRGEWAARHEEALRAPSRSVADMAEQVCRTYRAVLRSV
jgi:glycosyltransferase involved in cell wall biosynthesis